MRILYFADIRLPLERANGIQSMETCHALAERGHDVTLVARPDTHSPARDPYEYYGLPRLSGFRIELAPVLGPQFVRRVGYLSFTVGRVMGAGRADVVFTRDLGVAAMLAKLPTPLRPPLVYESHGYAPQVAEELPHLIATAHTASSRKIDRLAAREALVWREAAGYVTITQALADALTARFGARENLATVPDGVRLRPGRQRAAAPEGPPIVGYAGHLYAWKGVDVLIDALARTAGVRGLIVGGHPGEPDMPRVRALIDRLDLSSRVELTGQVAPGAVPALLERANILVLPNLPTTISSQFTSPLKLFEYMAAGRAIVASDLPALGEVLQDGVNAVLVPAGDPAALAAAIARLAADPALADRLGARAFADAAEFSWQRRAERLEAVLTKAQNR